MKTSEILKAAEQYLWDGVGILKLGRKTAFLCSAVRFADPGRPAGRRARSAIANRIFPHDDYIAWATAHGHLPILWLHHRDYWYPIIQANRLRWLRELQREYHEKGD